MLLVFCQLSFKVGWYPPKKLGRVTLSESKWRIQDGRWFQFPIYVINDVIMPSLLVLKIINVFANFLISSDPSVFKCIFAL